MSEFQNGIVIREMITPEDLDESLRTIRNAFVTVADDLNLTEENCPSNPAFLKPPQLKALQEKGLRLFGAHSGAAQVGFIAVEQADPDLFYLEKVAVIPSYRHRGIGKRLLDFGFDFVRRQNGKRVSIAVINENSILKAWYTAYGFHETGLKKFPHLPFTVCFMEKGVVEGWEN